MLFKYFFEQSLDKSERKVLEIHLGDVVMLNAYSLQEKGLFFAKNLHKDFEKMVFNLRKERLEAICHHKIREI